MTSYPTPVSNALSPPEGPKAVTTNLDFTTVASIQLDLELLLTQGYLRSVQSMFVDNSANTAALSITCGNGTQTLIIPPNSQAYLPALVSNPPRFIFATTGAVVVTVDLLNVPMPSAVWSVNAASALPVTSGKVQVQDVGVEAAIVSGYMQSQEFAVSTNGLTAIACDTNGNQIAAPMNGVPVSRSKITVASTSTSLVAANTARRFLLVQAPATADVWLNLLGGTASVGGADCFIVPQGTIWQTHEYVPTGAVTYFCATAALELSCIEG